MQWAYLSTSTDRLVAHKHIIILYIAEKLAKVKQHLEQMLRKIYLKTKEKFKIFLQWCAIVTKVNT